MCVEVVRRVLQKLRVYRLFAKLSRFHKPSVNLLGHMVSADGIGRVQPQGFIRPCNWLRPKPTGHHAVRGPHH